MKPALHEEEKRQFERLLGQLHIGCISDRMAVLDSFLDSEEHHTARGWQKLIKQNGSDLDLDFVTQTLELLKRLGLATRREFEGEEPRYEHRHLDEHHDHLICTKCGSITEFHRPELEALQDRVARENGFHCLRHKLQIYGICDKCMAEREPSMPLSMASPGERVRIERIVGGDMASRHLSDLGLSAGSEVEVISANGGPMVVAVKGVRVALGRGVAHKVQITPVPLEKSE
ncbi:transcriptional repressor [Dethiosulfatarculus sandiegensis]|uniref:Ferric uptake regulation protein n=1 Tax=Dethiosulfatarculus sandiegensis TaxID=1429043 RepID=A0A0D2GKH6_9BACT|nr:transcriptional repressor [Dethiosulfatarculus sandiegensis]KIX15267.1 Fur family transcriptional regulator [Dethiosulfatarculus sandiegensis]